MMCYGYLLAFMLGALWRVESDYAEAGAVQEEDPEGTNNEGMFSPPLIDHIEPMFSGKIIFCLWNMHAVLLVSIWN